MRDAQLRLGVWIFLGSETLLFAGLFALYAGYRMEQPAAFAAGVAADLGGLGAAMTAVLLVSSGVAAAAVRLARAGRRRAAQLALLAVVGLGAAFLGMKLFEYADHLGSGHGPGSSTFFALYFLMTGLHGLHVIGGMLALTVLARRATPIGVELGALYWHMVDVVWIFLWPLFYLVRG